MTKIAPALTIASLLLLYTPLSVAKMKRRGPLPSQLPVPSVPRLLSKAPGKEVKIGTWIKYQVTEKRLNRKFSMKIAFVGRENGGRQTWIEVELKHTAQIIYIKMLYDGKPGKRMGKVRKTIMKMGSLQAMEVPVKQAKNMLPVLIRKPMVKPRLVGTIDVKTPAGEFKKANKIRGVDADGGIVEVVYHKSVLLWGLLSINNSDVAMNLLGQGIGARTRITEKPAPFTLPR